MTNAEVERHFKRVDAVVRRVAPVSAFAFGLGCLERTWPVLVLAAKQLGKEILMLPVREALERMWECFSSGEPVDDTLASRAAALVDEQAAGVSGALLFNLGASFSDFGSAVLEQDVKYSGLVAARPIDVLDVLRDDAVIEEPEASGLVKAELKRQATALDLLLGAADISTIKENALASSLVGPRRLDLR